MAHGPWTHNTLARLSLIGVCQGQSIVTVHHFEAPGSTESGLADDLAAQTWAATIGTDWNANCKSAYLGAHTNDYTLLNIQTQVLERPGNVNHVLTPTDLAPTGGAVGTIGAPADDMTTSVLLRWRSTQAGKRHRGRTYIGPLSDTQSDQGKLVAGQVTLYTAYTTVMLNRYTGLSPIFTGGNLTIYSRPYNTGEVQWVVRGPGGLVIVTPPDYNGDSTFVTTASVDSILRTQRRRQLGVGA